VRYSIIRRSVGVTGPFLLGHAFNYALFWGANRILDTGSFGLFYTAMLSINVLMSPMAAVTVVLARRFAEIGAHSGSRQIVALTWRLLGMCLRVTPLVLGAAFAIAVAAKWIGIEAWQIVVLVPMTVLALIAVEILRCSMQGMLQFARATALWVTATGLSCIFAFAALFISMKVWLALAGLLVGTLIVVGVFLRKYPRNDPHRSIEALLTVELDLVRAVPMIVSYSLFILLNNIDILVGYVVLSRADLDAYAASALLPKAIVTATYAIAQVALPVIAEQRSAGARFRHSAVKALGLSAIAAIAAATFLWFAVPLAQQTVFAIRKLDFELLEILAIGSVALSMLRIIVVVEVALHRYSIGLAQAGAIGAFVLVCLTFGTHPINIAAGYAVTVGSFLLFSCFWLVGVRALERKRLTNRLSASQVVDNTGLR
jgi:O-antigen/teichoic acid export membrane protein